MKSAAALVFFVSGLAAQTSPRAAQTATPAAAAPAIPAPGGQNDEVLKAVDDLMWRMKLGDIAEVDKFSYTSLPPARQRNPTAQGAGNPMIVYAYSFIPKKLDRARKQPADRVHPRRRA